jgi:hypothetical protein
MGRGGAVRPILFARNLPNITTARALPNPNTPARCQFMMDQISIRCPNDLQTGIARAKTKFDIVKVARQIFIKPTQLIEDCLSQHHACSCNR